MSGGADAGTAAASGRIFVDADACPVKEEAIRVAGRHGLQVLLVSDGGLRPRAEPFAETVVVAGGMDAADDWIAERIGPGDLCITSDIPLADRCLKAGAAALKPNGQAFTEDSIGMAMATRSLMQDLRDSGTVTGGPRPFSKADRSAFLNAMETAVQRLKRTQRR
jgi:uncharacterized protein YaiI (UPF0178 family)